MQQVFAIARQAIRGAIRSRVFVSILALLFLVLIGLPLIIKGDGTAAGHARILLRYSLGLATLLLAVATVWSACAAISREIEERRLLLVVCKPVARFRIWLGKWVGIVTVAAVLTAIAGLLAYGQLLWAMRSTRLTEPERATLRRDVLVAMQIVRPAPRAPQKTVVVAPGQMGRWVFQIPGAAGRERRVALRFRLASSTQRQNAALRGTWLIGAPAAAARHRYAEPVVPGVHQIKIPHNAIPPDGALAVEYANLDDSATAVFAAADGVELLVEHGGFLMNYVRALCMMFLQLALLAAFGLLAGSLLSLPVAAFVSFVAMALLAAQGYVRTVAARGLHAMGMPGEAGPRLLDYFVAGVFNVLNLFVQPLAEFRPLEAVAEGRLVSWGLLGQAALVLILLYAGILALLSAWLFGRREIGLAA